MRRALSAVAILAITFALGCSQPSQQSAPPDKTTKINLQDQLVGTWIFNVDRQVNFDFKDAGFNISISIFSFQKEGSYKWTFYYLMHKKDQVRTIISKNIGTYKFISEDHYLFETSGEGGSNSGEVTVKFYDNNKVGLTRSGKLSIARRVRDEESVENYAKELERFTDYSTKEETLPPPPILQ